MPYCALHNCKSSSKNNKKNKSSEITFHRFLRPGHENRDIWIKFVRQERCEDRWKPSEHSRLCSLHFRDEDFDFKETGRRFLKKTAVPLNDLSKSDLKKKSEIYSSSAIVYGKSEEKDDTKLNSDNDITDDDHNDTSDDDDDLQTVRRTQRRSKSEKQGHYFGIKCTNCQRNIIGFRYTCVQCPAVELCAACEARQAHAAHYVLRVPGPRPQWEVKEMLSRVREAVRRVLSSRSKLKVDEPKMIKKVIKQEAKDPLREVPNARPHESNILEQALIDIPLIKGECIDPDTDIRTGEVATLAAQTDPVIVTDNAPGLISGKPPATGKRRRADSPVFTDRGLRETDAPTPAKMCVTSQAAVDPGDFTVFTHVAPDARAPYTPYSWNSSEK